jgi:hypothetical protein
VPHRPQGFEAIAVARGVDVDALGGAVIDGCEDRGGSLEDRHGGRRVGAPHDVGTLGDDGAFVRAFDDKRRLPGGRQELGFPITRSTRRIDIRTPFRVRSRGWAILRKDGSALAQLLFAASEASV